MTQEGMPRHALDYLNSIHRLGTDHPSPSSSLLLPEHDELVPRVEAVNLGASVPREHHALD
jgi:hypothetical protein